LQRLSAPQNRQVNSLVLGIASPPSQRLTHKEQGFVESVCGSKTFEKAT